MNIITPGDTLPTSFTATCIRQGRHCGAIMEVTADDCFKAAIGQGWMLSFFCGHCGVTLTPDYELLMEDSCQGIAPELLEELGIGIKTKDNVPPWSSRISYN